MDRVLAEYPGSDLQLSAEYWLAESHYRLRHYPQAGVLFDQLELATAGRDDAWLAMIPLRRAQVRAHAGQWNEAYEIARPIAERFPDCAQLHEVNYLLGRYFMNRAEFDEAREAYQSVVVSTTGAKTETAAMAQWMIGETYFMQREYNQAIKAYHRVRSPAQLPAMAGRGAAAGRQVPRNARPVERSHQTILADPPNLPNDARGGEGNPSFADGAAAGRGVENTLGRKTTTRSEPMPVRRAGTAGRRHRTMPGPVLRVHDKRVNAMQRHETNRRVLWMLATVCGLVLCAVGRLHAQPATPPDIASSSISNNADSRVGPANEER